MEVDIHNQTQDLPVFARKLRDRPRSGTDPSRMIFTGSGDSFAASLLAQSLTEGRAVAEDPYELYLNPELVRGKTLVLISASGRTRTNVRLARRVSRLAKRRLAVSANPASPLAKICDDVIELQYRSAGTLTAGTLSFTSSLLAVAFLSDRLPLLPDLKAMEKRAAEWGERVGTVKAGDFLFVGSDIGYGLAAYGAFKIHEVLGFRAEYQYPEQVGHAQLFSIRKSSDNVICVSLSRDKKTAEVFRALSENGFRVHLLESKAGPPFSTALEAAFCMQHLALSLARNTGLRECAFLTNRGRLRLSNQLIY